MSKILYVVRSAKEKTLLAHLQVDFFLSGAYIYIIYIYNLQINFFNNLLL